MQLGLSEALPSLVNAAFKSAKASGSLLFSQTQLAVLRTSSGVPIQLRFCPTLAHKPLPQSDAAPKKISDPFENPPPALHIANVPTANPSHVLVLNKFPIIAEHFILATKSNKKQTHALEQDDLEATYACLMAWQQGPGNEHRRLFAFFNSGPYSGASQPHRHVQFLPVERMRDSSTANGWELLVDLILSGRVQHTALPFTYFACSFDGEPSGPALLHNYNKLHQQATGAVKRFIATDSEWLTLHATDDGDSPISYNLAMTSSGMVMLPRRAEGTDLQSGSSDKAGFVALNGTTLGGTMMVKQQEEWEMLRSQPERLDDILRAIGIPREHQPPGYQPHV